MTVIVNEKHCIHFELYGQKGSMLMLHHGLFGSAQDWIDWGYVDNLSQDHRLIAVNARGHGRSDNIEDVADFSIDALARDMEELIEQLQIRYLNFFGFSLGALVGIRLKQLYPQRIHNLILANIPSAEMLNSYLDRIELEPKQLNGDCALTEQSELPSGSPHMIKAMRNWNVELKGLDNCFILSGSDDRYSIPTANNRKLSLLSVEADILQSIADVSATTKLLRSITGKTTQQD